MDIQLAKALQADRLAQLRHAELIREARAGRLQPQVRESRELRPRFGLARLLSLRPRTS
ncbi:MAG TPA: hypothetical protein VE777_04580 [Gaiellales bacterium]|jgi:hypothetical protein|nr:hypothetical protein [Gaiellales bacterium]